MLATALFRLAILDTAVMMMPLKQGFGDEVSHSKDRLMNGARGAFVADTSEVEVAQRREHGGFQLQPLLAGAQNG